MIKKGFSRWHCLALICFTFINTKMVSSRKRFRVLRVEVTPEIYRQANNMNTFDIMSSAKNIVPIDTPGSFNSHDQSFTNNNQQNIRGNPSRNNRRERFEKQVSRSINPFDQLMFEMLREHAQPEVTREPIKQQRNNDASSTRVSTNGDFFRDQQRSTNRNEFQSTRNQQQNIVDSNFSPQNHQSMFQSSQNQNMDGMMTPNFGMFGGSDLNQMGMNGGFYNPFDSIWGQSSDMFYPGLFQGDGEMDIANFMMTPSPRMMNFGRPMQQSNQPSRRQKNMMDAILTQPPPQVKQRDDIVPTEASIPFEQENQRRRTAPTKLSPTITTSDIFERPIDIPPPIKQPTLEQEIAKNIVDGKRSQQNTKTSHGNTRRKTIDGIPNPSREHKPKPTETKVFQIESPNSNRVVEVHIESNRPDLTKGILMDLLTNPGLHFGNSKGGSQPTSLLSLLTGKKHHKPQITVEVVRPKTTQQTFHSTIQTSPTEVMISDPRDPKGLASKHDMPGIPIPEFIDGFTADRVLEPTQQQITEPRPADKKPSTQTKRIEETPVASEMELPPIVPAINVGNEVPAVPLLHPDQTKVSGFVGAVPPTGLFRESPSQPNTPKETVVLTSSLLPNIAIPIEGRIPEHGLLESLFSRNINVGSNNQMESIITPTKKPKEAITNIVPNDDTKVNQKAENSRSFKDLNPIQTEAGQFESITNGAQLINETAVDESLIIIEGINATDAVNSTTAEIITNTRNADTVTTDKTPSTEKKEKSKSKDKKSSKKDKKKRRKSKRKKSKKKKDKSNKDKKTDKKKEKTESKKEKSSDKTAKT